MKIRLVILIFLTSIISWLMLSCESKDQSKVFYEQKLNQIENLSSFQYVIILPSLGCQGCISGVEEYLKNNIERTNVLFILTSLESLKLLQNKIGFDLKNRVNVLIDLDNDFLLTSDSSIYPIVLSMQNSKIETLHYISPDTGKSIVDIIQFNE